MFSYSKLLYPKISQWIQRVNTGSADDIQVYRSNKLSLSNMAIGALKKHITDQVPGKLNKHNKRMKELQSVRRDMFVPAEKNAVEPNHLSASCGNSNTSAISSPTASCGNSNTSAISSPTNNHL